MALFRIEDSAACAHDLAETLQIFGRVVASTHEQLSNAPMQYALGKYLQFSQFSDKLDVAEHFALGVWMSLVQLVPVEGSAVLRESIDVTL